MTSDAAVEYLETGMVEPPLIVSGKDFLAMDIKPRPALMDWLKERDTLMIHAWRGVGKTWFSLGMAVALASGKDFLGWKVEGKQAVLYVDGEMPQEDLQGRVKSLTVGMAPEELDYLDLYAADMQEMGIPSLSTAEGREHLDRIIDQRKPSVVFLDNLATLAQIQDTTEGSQAWYEVQSWLLKHRRQGRTMIFIHHQGKSGKQRGLSQKEDTLSTVIGLYRPDTALEEDGCVFDLRFEKRRGDKGSGLNVRLIRESEGVSWSWSDLTADLKDRCVQLQEDGLNYRDIADATGLSKSKVGRILKGAKK